MPFAEAVRDRIFASLVGRISWSVFKNMRNRYQLRPGASIALQTSFPAPEEEAGYVRYMFADYHRMLMEIGSGMAGKDVLELGPGDNLGVALLCLVNGARSVTCIDKYKPTREPDSARALYRAMRLGLPGEEHAAFDAAREALDSERLRTLYDCPVEDASERLRGKQFDIVFSRSVLEYLKDSDAAFAAMDTLLKPGGVMVHKVDCRDDGLFTHYGYNPLTFLTLSEPLYQWMTSHTYRPNRRRISYYRTQLQRYEYATHLLTTRVMGQEGELETAVRELVGGRHYQQRELQLVREVRGRLAREFRELSDEDLLTAGFFLVGIKPDWPGEADPVMA